MQGFGWKTEGKKPPGRPRHRWEDNIKTNLKEIEWKGVDWVHMTEDTGQVWSYMTMVMNLRVL